MFFLLYWVSLAAKQTKEDRIRENVCSESSCNCLTSGPRHHYSQYPAVMAAHWRSHCRCYCGEMLHPAMEEAVALLAEPDVRLRAMIRGCLMNGPMQKSYFKF